MNMRKWSSIFFASLGLLALILDGRTGLQGAAEGIDLCIRTVIPSLFPFLFLCSILTNSLWGGNLTFLRPLGAILGIPKGSESLLIAGFLGGYPAGAQAIGEAHRKSLLDKTTAEQLLGCCSNAGPAFLFGMVASRFEDAAAPWALWSIVILSACFTGTSPAGSESTCALPAKSETISAALTRTVRTMGLICGWIVLFRVLFSFLERWVLWYFPKEIQVTITGLLELSNGCCALSSVADFGLRFLLASAMLSFGGICVAMQTASVIGDLSMTSYLLGKLRQTVISLLLAAAYLRFGWCSLIVSGCILALMLKLQKKRWISGLFRCIIPLSPPGGKNHAVS